jgi:hypothetical protein
VERQYALDNTRERERLRNLVSRMTDEELVYPLYAEGWTIAAGLAHLAFGDQRTLVLLRKWQKNGITEEPPLDIHPINDAALPLFLAIPPRVIANLAVSSAEACDRKLEEASEEIVAALEKLAPGRLYRAPHRKLHLDEIEAILYARRGGKRKE